jgi:O-antigen/teichoic acid export membrane protein
LLLTLAHHRFPWWLLHPIGFGVAQAFGTTFVVFSVFLSWFIKLLLLKIGVVGLYRRGLPFFVGMMVGYVVVVAVSYGVDLIWFPQNGHILHSW